MKETSLTKQLISICILIVGIIFIALGIILPKELLPIYEENIYNKLKQPLIFVNNDEDINKEDIKLDTDIAYIYIINNSILTSNNINKVIPNYNNDIIKYITNKNGKFTYKNKIYYYYYYYINKNEVRISLTNDKYINEMRGNILHTILIITGITFTICSLILIIWSNNLVNQIILLKKKIDNLDNDKYKVNLHHNFKDEISSLNDSIENMKTYLKNNENYKNQMY